MLLLGGMISLSGIVFGVLLAFWLSRGVIRPILRVTSLIERIGRGDFSATATARIENSVFGDPMGEMQTTLHQMAKRLAHSRDDLEMQVSTATQTMREKMEEAEQATQAKTRFLAAASHDLRQPTHALGLFVTRLAQLSHDEQTRGLIVNLQASVVAMQNLLDSLLDISRLEAKAVPVKCQSVGLSGLMQQLRHDLGQQARDKGLQLRICQTSLHVSSDATLVYRILLNLVGNALRYTHRGGVLVACRTVDAGQNVQIQVWDTGIGIAMEHQQDVFKEFYQIGNAGRDRNKGLGLGLSIVQRTADLLGHPLGLTSRIGVGSRFTLTLPLTQALPDIDLGPSVNQASLHDLKGVNVWVIEDDDMVMTALVGLLEDWGMRVQGARDLQAAGKLVEQGMAPDLILSDYRLQQDQNGIEVIQQLRLRLNRLVPACLMSGNTDADLMAAAQVAELTLLHKPVRPAKLRNLMRRLLAKGQVLDEDLP
jgi:signal transduction histidine kinase/ActR/RegA family two-component response regulator